MKALFLGSVIAASVVAAPTYQTIFRGTKGCELRVVWHFTGEAAGGRGWEAARAVVATSYSHHGHSHPNIMLAGDPKNGRRMFGGLKDGTRMELLLDVAEEFKTAASYALRWKHGSHFHNESCTGLKQLP